MKLDKFLNKKEKIKTMSKNKYYLLVSLIGLLVTTAAVVSISSANWGGKDGFKHGDMSGAMQEKYQGIKTIFEDGDYDTWAKMMNEKADLMEEKADEIKESITQENFEKMIQMYESKEKSDYSGHDFKVKGGMMKGHMFNE